MGKRKRSVYPALFLAIAAFGIGNFFFISSDFFERLSSYMIYPVMMVQQKIVAPIKIFFERKYSIEQLQQQLKTLQESREKLVAETISLRATLHYADDIQEVMEFKKNYENLHGTIVQILAKNISDQAHFILIDAGANKGITKDMVALYKNGLVGRVEEVYPLYSKVVLITDRTCKVAASCAITHAHGIHEGCNDEHRCLLNRVSHLSAVQEQDMVLSSGEGLIFPRGFALGQVKSIVPEGLMYRVEVEPIFDIRTINYCFLMRRS